MTRWVNHSGTAVNVPVAGRDVENGEEVDVPDDVILPANYFSAVGAAADTVAASDAGFGVHVEEE